MKSESESHSVVSNSLGPHGLYSPWNSLGQNTEVGSLFLLQEIFPNQGLYPGLSHCRQILYQLNHKGSLRILEWVAYPFSGVSHTIKKWIQRFPELEPIIQSEVSQKEKHQYSILTHIYRI